MRLLIIAPKVSSIDEVKNFSGVFSFFLSRELKNMGVELQFDPPMHNSGRNEKDLIKFYGNLATDTFDHILALPIRYFTRLPESVFNVLKKNMPRGGQVTQIHDRKLANPIADCTFTISDQGNDKKHYAVGWAADPELIKPAQDKNVLRILIDHPDYVSRDGDKTATILKSAIKFAGSDLWRDKFSSVLIRHIIDGAFLNYDGEPVQPYARRSIPYRGCCLEYSKSHLFMVTHHESAGLSALEASMAGALVVTPSGFINPDRAATIRRLTYEGTIPWEEVLNKIDIEASREIAMMNSWKSVAMRIVNWFQNK